MVQQVVAVIVTGYISLEESQTNRQRQTKKNLHMEHVFTHDLILCKITQRNQERNHHTLYCIMHTIVYAVVSSIDDCITF